MIVTDCNSLAYKWEELSAFLGLRRSVIEGIKKNHPCDVTGCLNDALGQWIEQKYNTNKYGMPSWRRLLEAIALIDNRIFKKLAREHEGKIISSVYRGHMALWVLHCYNTEIVRELDGCRF